MYTFLHYISCYVTDKINKFHMVQQIHVSVSTKTYKENVKPET